MAGNIDPNIDCKYNFKKIGVNMYHLYNRSKKVMGIVAGRDFVFNNLNVVEPDGSVILCAAGSKDIEHLMTTPKGVVRGWSPISGWLIKPDP